MEPTDSHLGTQSEYEIEQRDRGNKTERDQLTLNQQRTVHLTTAASVAERARVAAQMETTRLALAEEKAKADKEKAENKKKKLEKAEDNKEKKRQATTDQLQMDRFKNEVELAGGLSVDYEHDNTLQREACTATGCEDWVCEVCDLSWHCAKNTVTWAPDGYWNWKTCAHKIV